MINRQLFCAFIFIFSCLFLKAQDTTSFKFRPSGSGINYVSVTVNDEEVEMIFDTGAAEISMPKSKAKLLEKLGKILPSDYTGVNKTYTLASGDTVSGREIIFRNIKVGDMEFSDVEGGILNRDSADVLLGQSVFRRLTSYSINNVKKTITFIYDSAQFQALQPVIKFDCKDKVANANFYKSLGIKSTDVTWTEADFSFAIKVLKKINEQCPELLPSKNNPETKVLFQRILEQRELFEIAKRSVQSREFKYQTFEVLFENSLAMVEIYSEGKHDDEGIDLLNQLLNFFETTSQFNIEKKEDYSSEELEKTKNNVRSTLNILFWFFQDKFKESYKPADTEKFLIRLLELTPQFLKIINQSEVKAIYTERLWLLQHLPNSAELKSALEKAFKAVLPKNPTSKAEEDREALWKRVQAYPVFVKNCLFFEGRFVRSDKPEKISFRFYEDDKNPELILLINNADLKIVGRVLTRNGFKQTPEFNVSKENMKDMKDYIFSYILPKLYEFETQ